MWAINQLPEETSAPLNPKRPVPRPRHLRRPMTVQKTQKGKTKRVLLTLLTVVVILGILVTAGYFIKKLIESKYFFCTRSVKFIPLEKTCDGNNDCAGGEDETSCLSGFTDNTTFPVRLMSTQRVLQVYNSGLKTWRSVCWEDWTLQHTKTACEQLGYTNKPNGKSVPVSVLLSSMKTGPFAAVRSGTQRTPIHQATIIRNVCSSGSVVSLTCSDCGEGRLEDRIVGGTDTTIEKWPWQVSLQQAGHHKCGGTLISPRWVITAAHCFAGSRLLSQWRVMSGQTHISTLEGSYVDRIIIHGNYDPNRVDYDIALMRLSSSITVGDKRMPVCLPPKSFNLPDDAPVTVTGWGSLEEGGSASNVLQQADVRTIARSRCTRADVYGSVITIRMLCAGFLAGGVDACQGDSGGPLVYLSSSKWNLIGVVSWGAGCAQQKKPGVYTNVEEMLNWVYTVMEKNP
ncbi:transmembrane protease serine 4a [Pholidichthys leucotaenia]